MKKNYPSRLFHTVPCWIPPGEVFHIRIRCHKKNQKILTDPDVAPQLLDSVLIYQKQKKWFVHLFMIMPDHIHALVTFPPHEKMALITGNWKRYHAVNSGILWQDNFFDHRIRNDKEYLEKAGYIRRNPAAANLCQYADDWLWVYPKIIHGEAD
ncbi:MAG: transposase [Kiritimatiellales bacterium]